MWKCRAVISIVIAMLFFPAIAWANPKPSFDCAKASSFAEIAICSNDELAQLDVRMSKAYKAHLATASNITSEKAAQRAWVKKREACGSVACIKKLYGERIPELGGGIVVAAANNADEPAGTFVVANTLPPDDYLSLRTEPSTKIGSRITKMANGTELRVLDRRSDGWWRVEIVATGQSGWASSGSSKKYIVWKPSTKTASTTSTTNAKAAADAKAEADARAARNAKAIADAKAAKAAAKIAADEKAAKLAADEAREAATEQVEKDQAVSEISATLGNPDPADLLLFFNEGDNVPNLAKNLDGQLVSATGTLSVCHTEIVSPYAGARGQRYEQLVADFLVAALPSGAEPSSVDLDHCGSRTPVDVVYFQLGQLEAVPLKFVKYLGENLNASLAAAGTFSLQDAENAEASFIAAQQKALADKAALKTATLENIRSGTAEGFGFVVVTGTNAPLCYFDGGEIAAVMAGHTEQVLQQILTDAEVAQEVSKLNTSLKPLNSLDDVYIGITRKPPSCGWMFGDRTSLQKVAAAMDRDGIAFDTMPYWTTADEIAPIIDAAKIEQQTMAEAKAAQDAEAALAAEKRAADERAAAQKEAAEKAAAETKEREAKLAAEAAGKEAAAAAEEERRAQMPAFKAYVTCLLNGDVNNTRPAWACMTGSSNSPGGSASITNNGQQTDFTPAMMMRTFRQNITLIDLSEDFEIKLQANSEEYFVLNLEIRDRDDQVVFQGQASQYKSINVKNVAPIGQNGVKDSIGEAASSTMTKQLNTVPSSSTKEINDDFPDEKSRMLGHWFNMNSFAELRDFLEATSRMTVFSGSGNIRNGNFLDCNSDPRYNPEEVKFLLIQALAAYPWYRTSKSEYFCRSEYIPNQYLGGAVIPTLHFFTDQSDFMDIRRDFKNYVGYDLAVYNHPSELNCTTYSAVDQAGNNIFMYLVNGTQKFSDSCDGVATVGGPLVDLR